VKVVVAPDSFKGSLSAVEAARAVERGLRSAARARLADAASPAAHGTLGRAAPGALGPGAQGPAGENVSAARSAPAASNRSRRRLVAPLPLEVELVPLADGGEGTVDALVAATDGQTFETEASDPLGRPVTARYGILGDGRTAVIEMAAASGLPLLAAFERDPMKAQTFGTGELILEAARRGASSVIVGIGGSATVDGGTGMARALGVRFLDEDGRELSGGGEILRRIDDVDVSGLADEVRGLEVRVACDVKNPLTGPEGAARVFAPQKGASPREVERLEAGLENLARVLREKLGRDVAALPGAGAAGGLGAGLAAFLGGRLEEGSRIVTEAVRLASRLEGAALLITGEGCADGQSAFGKAPVAAAETARAAGVPAILLAGSIGEGADRLLEMGVSAVFSIARGPSGEHEMIRDAGALLEWSAEQALRAFLAGSPGAAGAETS